ncbi:uncharacterized protein K02A2.6-like [Coccinella septempunctata]|uniref:uncharacterized protein K02A2.6-like n=1 Tax=Coccinella septempunctata TaxID=41139 RepID=UPI001D0624A5|nr:uncharacterized protein K02A2.6-like [Coccinella septempunctata]
MLDAEAYKLMYSLCSPEKPDQKSFDDLIRLFGKQMLPQEIPLAERFKFYQARKGEEESPKEWAASIRGLAVRCKFGNELNNCLRDKFFCGYEKGPVLDRLLEEKITVSLEEMVALAENKMAAQNHFQQQMATGTTNMKTEALQYVERRRGKEKATNRNTEPPRTSEKCRACGKPDHEKAKCSFRNYFCRICNKKGHLAVVCFENKANENKNTKYILNRHYYVEDQRPLPHDDLELFSIENEGDRGSSFKIDLTVNKVKLTFQIETGASVSAISEKCYKNKLSHLPLLKTDKVFYFYNGMRVLPVGYINADITYNSVKKHLKIYVMINGGPPNAGRDLLEMYNSKFSDVNFVRVEHRNLDELLTKYKNLFELGLGKFTKGTASINIKDIVTPHFIKYRPVPYAIKEKVEIELNRLLSLGVIEPVDFSDWATPVVPVLKKGEQEVRLCGDYKVTINPCIEVDKYPLPRIEDFLGALSGGKKFSKLDLSQAYQQICVDDESEELFTISTHKGLFRYNRLTYGVVSAPAKFQKIMESLLSGIEGIEILLNDILVTGPSDEKHLSRLEKVLRILSEAGFRLNIEKCEFFKEQFEYLGY